MKIDDLIRRIDVAIESSAASRAEVYLELPECHKAKCQGRHPDGSAAFGIMQRQIRQAISHELRYRTTTRPDIDRDDDPHPAAVTLAHLLRTYNVHDTGTYIRAAELLIEAYPTLGAALERTTNPPTTLTRRARTIRSARHGRVQRRNTR